MAARAGKRRADAYAVRMVKKRAKREAKSLECGVSKASPRFLPPTMELLPGEPSPVSRPGDWLTWRAARFVAGGPGLISAAQGLAMARSAHMARSAATTGSARVRRPADHGPDMVPQGEGPDPVPILRSAGLPWF